MESKITARNSLLLLNDDCLMGIFEFINIDDSINLGKSCSRLRFVADLTFKKHSKFQLDSSMVRKGEEYIIRLFQHIGQHVTSLKFAWTDKHRNLNKMLGEISNNCKHLKNLELSILTRMCDEDVQPVYHRFDNVEQLSLSSWNVEFTEDFTNHFFESFRRLKAVNIVGSSIGSNELETVFRYNRSIESFVYSSIYSFNRPDFNCQLLELIPNVESLCLIGNIPGLDSLLKLDRLTKLQLRCHYKNINNFLSALSTKGIIEEMYLESVALDDDFFNILTSFSKLKLLVMVEYTWVLKLKTSMVWPAQLKKLRLYGFELTHDHLIEMIRQLEGIESIDVGVCKIAEDDIINFKDVTKLSQYIRNSNRKQCLDVVLPYVVASPSKKYISESERLRILYQSSDKYNPLGIQIYFDGCDFLNSF